MKTVSSERKSYVGQLKDFLLPPKDTKPRPYFSSRELETSVGVSSVTRGGVRGQMPGRTTCASRTGSHSGQFFVAVLKFLVTFELPRGPAFSLYPGPCALCIICLRPCPLGTACYSFHPGHFRVTASSSAFGSQCVLPSSPGATHVTRPQWLTQTATAFSSSNVNS